MQQDFRVSQKIGWTQWQTDQFKQKVKKQVYFTSVMIEYNLNAGQWQVGVVSSG